MEISLGPIRVQSDYDYRQFRDFFIFNFFRGKYYQLNILFDFAGMPVLYALIKLFLFFRTATFSFGLFDLLYLAFYLLLVTYVVLAPRIYYNQARATADTALTMEFGEEDFIISYQGPLSSGEATYQYDALYRIYELPEMFYLYVSSSQAFLLSKAKLYPQEVLALRRLFMQKTHPSLYVLCASLGRRASTE